MSRPKTGTEEKTLGEILKHCKNIVKRAQCIRRVCKEDLKEETEIFAFFDGFMAYIDELLSFIINAIENPNESPGDYSVFSLHAGEILEKILLANGDNPNNVETIRYDLMPKGETKNEQAENGK